MSKLKECLAEIMQIADPDKIDDPDALKSALELVQAGTELRKAIAIEALALQMSRIANCFEAITQKDYSTGWSHVNLGGVIFVNRKGEVE